MESVADLPLEETRLWLSDYAQRRFVPVPAELIAAHVIAVTKGADFPVRRAAIEALHRRMQNVESDGLFVKQCPERTMLGKYTIARHATRKDATRKRHETRPYETVLRSVAPLRGQCSCPDFLKGGLGLCKHLLTAIAHVFEKPKRADAAQRESALLGNGRLQDVTWDPAIPLIGSGDRLLGLRVPVNCSLQGFKNNGSVDLSQLGDSRVRAAFVRNLLGQVQTSGRRRPVLSAGPDVKATRG